MLYFTSQHIKKCISNCLHICQGEYLLHLFPISEYPTAHQYRHIFLNIYLGYGRCNNHPTLHNLFLLFHHH